MSNGIYVASKVKHAPLWRQYRNQGYPIIASWIDQDAPGVITDWAVFWDRLVKEASTCRALVAYRADDTEVWKGALVEIGSALAHGIPVFIAGKLPEGHSWLEHPLVELYHGLDRAMELAHDLCKEK